jgi:sulfur-carrier protein
MPLEVHLPTVLRQHAGGQATIQASGSTVAEVFEDVITEDGKLHKFVNVYRNDEDIRFLDHLQTKVSDDDVISVLPAVAGG